MTWPDIVNGTFELFGAPFIAISIFKLYHEKRVAGVSFIHAGFFATWSLWNLFYYPHLEQWFSFAGGILIMCATVTWFIQLVYYRNRK